MLGGLGMLCGTASAEMAVLEGFRTLLYSKTLAGFFILEVSVGGLCLEIDCLFINWENDSTPFVSQQ